MFLAGVRDNPNDPFSYLRIPADDNDTVNEWMRLRAALQNPALRQQAATRYAARAMPQAAADAVRGQLQESAAKSLDIFAGNGKRVVSWPFRVSWRRCRRPSRKKRPTSS